MVAGTLMYPVISSSGAKACGATFDEVTGARGHEVVFT